MPCLNPTYSNCIEFTADLKQKLSALGFKSTNLEDFILELVKKESLSQKVSALETAVSNLNSETIKANAKTYGLTSGSADAIKLTNRSVDYTIEDEQLTYNFSRLVSELPEGIVYLSARADIVDDGGKRASIKGKRNVLPITTPATIVFSIDLKSANGNLTLERSVRAEGNVDKSAILDVRDFTTGVSDMSIKDHLEALSSKVALLETRT